ncbi:hypothetical protein FKM95_000181 [Candidatus Tremblaya phenacola]|nr:hypothetical protein FKM95_000181 [Candidatus Tremblaya phenacola]
MDLLELLWVTFDVKLYVLSLGRLLRFGEESYYYVIMNQNDRVRNQMRNITEL